MGERERKKERVREREIHPFFGTVCIICRCTAIIIYTCTYVTSYFLEMVELQELILSC